MRLPRAFVVVASVLQVALGQDTDQVKWTKESGFSCQSRSGIGNTPLAIGRDGNAFDADVSADHCKDKCAKNVLCKGFEFQDISEETTLCRYKSQIDSYMLIRTPGTSCYIFQGRAVQYTTIIPPTRITVPPTTTTTTIMTTIPTVVETTTTMMPTTMATTTPFFFSHDWAVIRGVDCVTSLEAAMFIGETHTTDGSPTAFDKWPVDQCKQKCAQHELCHGFNYDGNIGVCRYQKHLSHSNTVRNDYNDCWIYERPTTRQTTTPTSPQDALNHWIRKGVGLLAGSVFGKNGRDDTPVVVHGRKLRGASAK